MNRGALLSPLVIGPDRLWRFQIVFGMAFLLYAVGWVASYFTLRGIAGEWAGSLIGSIFMALAIALAFGVMKTFFAQTAALFIATCGQVKEYSIEGRPGEKRTLQNWDTLQITFGNRSYALRLEFSGGSLVVNKFVRFVP